MEHMEYTHPVIITERNEIGEDAPISRYLRTPAGRSALAQSMIQPLTRRIDYAGIARKAFSIEQLPDGVLPVYSPEDE